MFNRIKSQGGFTLVEIIVAVTIIAVIAIFAIPKFVALKGDVEKKGITAAVTELNGRENLCWAKAQLDETDTGVIDDDAWACMQDGASGPYLGDGYEWTLPMVQSGETYLTFNGNVGGMIMRTPGDNTKPGLWTAPAGF